MLSSLRLVMTWLHTWFGLVLGFVLMVIFFFGSLTVFIGEIDRWVIPERRIRPSGTPSFDNVLRPALERLRPTAESLAEAGKRIGGPVGPNLTPSYWSAYILHNSTLGLYAEYTVKNPKGPDDYASSDAMLDPGTGNVMQDGFALGGDFFYPMHFSLMLRWGDLGIYLVGVATAILLATLVSGVVIHKKIFVEFFTFRAGKQFQRRVLDIHNLTGVLALPFHFVFGLTGLLIFAGIYLPVHETLLHNLHEKQHEREAAQAGTSALPRNAAGVAAPLAAVDPMILEAKRRWAALGDPAEVRAISISHVGDANSYVSIYPATSGRFAFEDGTIQFEGRSGKLLSEKPSTGAVHRATDFLIAIHLMPFDHALLRWLLFLGGMASCACIASGLLYFVGKRKRKHASQGVRGARIVDALAVATVIGTVVATLATLVLNRLLPADMPKIEERAWEIQGFFLVWSLCFVHAAYRSRPMREARLAPAWREQCYAAAVLAASAAALNWITTGDHLLKTIGEGYWSIAGVDLVLIATSGLAVVAGTRLKRNELTGGDTLPDMSLEPAEAAND